MEEAQAAAEQSRRSLRAFVGEMWPIVERRPFVAGWHIDAVCEHLEAVTAGEIRRLIINVPPRTTKSLLTGVFWPAWEWLVSPETQWLFASYSDTLATKHSLVCRRLIQSRGVRTGRDGLPWARRLGYQGLLELLGGSWDLADDEALKTRFSNTETGHRIATSVGGTATGEGGDRLVIDDPLKASEARSSVVRRAANEWHDETWSTRTNSPDSTSVLIMQRLHEQDLTGHLLERGGWAHLCLPAEYEPSHPFVWPRDPRSVEGESLDVVRLPSHRLVELKRDLGSYGYAGQMQQRPSPDGGGMFKRAWWKRWTPDMLPPAFDRVVASWDMRFSDSQAASSSFVVGQVWGSWGADRYLLGQVRARLSFTETLRAVKALDAWRPASYGPRGRVTATLVERKANGAAVIDTLSREITGLLPVEPEGGKDVRAAAVQPTVEAGNVFLPASEFIPSPQGFVASAVADFVEEHAAFPNGAHDDQVDGMSQALNWMAAHGGPAGAPVFTRKASRHRLEVGSTHGWSRRGAFDRRGW
jgi:predicted phage terminase large subunit-like protein